MSNRTLADGTPVPDDDSHKALKPNGQQVDYVVLSAEERAKGFVKPVRRSYIHAYPTEIRPKIGGCGAETTMSNSIAETYARNPHFYSGTFCVRCASHFPLDQFIWSDGEPMSPPLQAAWAQEMVTRRNDARAERISRLKAELAELEKQT